MIKKVEKKEDLLLHVHAESNLVDFLNTLSLLESLATKLNDDCFNVVTVKIEEIRGNLASCIDRAVYDYIQNSDYPIFIKDALAMFYTDCDLTSIQLDDNVLVFVFQEEE